MGCGNPTLFVEGLLDRWERHPRICERGTREEMLRYAELNSVLLVGNTQLADSAQALVLSLLLLLLLLLPASFLAAFRLRARLYFPFRNLPFDSSPSKRIVKGRFCVDHGPEHRRFRTRG